MDVLAASTDVTTYFVLRLAADGTEATGLTITNFDLQYVRSGVAPAAKVDATALAATDSAHGDNQAIEIDATDQPGLYRVDWPDAAFASGVREVVLSVKCATCFTEHLCVNLTAQAANVTHWSSTAIPAVHTAGYPIVTIKDGTGTGEINTNAGAVALVDLVTTTSTATAVTTVNGLAANVITAASMATDASAEIADAVWDEDATGHQTQGTFGQAIGDPVADANTIFKAVVTDATGATVGVDVAAVLDDTGTSGVVVASIAANAITATSIQNDAITAAKIAANAIDAATFAADVDAEILSYIVDDTTRIDASALNTASVTTIPAILVDTGTTLDGKLDTIDTNVDSILDDTGTSGVVLAESVYHADIQFTRDEANTQDEWTVTWFKNGVRQTSGITSPTIQLILRADGTDLLAATAMSQVGTTGTYKYDEDTDRVTVGEAVIAVASATIDGDARPFSRLIGRDST